MYQNQNTQLNSMTMNTSSMTGQLNQMLQHMSQMEQQHALLLKQVTS